MKETRVTGTIVNSFINCPREAWLQAHKLIPFQDEELLEIGRLISESTYARDVKKIVLDNIEIDLINSKEGNVLIGEVKKSSKSEDSARFQLLFYMYELKKRGINANGVLLFPKEKKRIYVQLSEEDEKLLNELISSIIDTINKPYPPEGNHKRCGPCAYREFCLS